MIIIDYDVREQVPPILESDVDQKVVICHTDFRSHQVIYYAVKNRRNNEYGVSFMGCWNDSSAQNAVIYTSSWNWSHTLINLMINKITAQCQYDHTFYIIDNEIELQELIAKLHIVNKHFIREVLSKVR